MQYVLVENVGYSFTIVSGVTENSLDIDYRGQDYH